MVKVKQEEVVTVELAKEMCGLGLCQYCPMLGCPVDDVNVNVDETAPTRKPERRGVEVDWLGNNFASRVKALVKTTNEWLGNHLTDRREVT